MFRDTLSPTLKPMVTSPVEGLCPSAFLLPAKPTPWGAHPLSPSANEMGGNELPGCLFLLTRVEISPKYVATKQTTPKQSTLDDLVRQVSRLIGTVNSVLERYAHGAENSQALYERFITFDRRIKKVLDELAERIERIERLELLDRTGHLASAREIRSEIKQELGSLQWQLARRIKNLNYLNEQAASYGAGRVDLGLINEIADEQEAIQELQAQLTPRESLG